MSYCQFAGTLNFSCTVEIYCTQFGAVTILPSLKTTQNVYFYKNLNYRKMFSYFSTCIILQLQKPAKSLSLKASVCKASQNIKYVHISSALPLFFKVDISLLSSEKLFTRQWKFPGNHKKYLFFHLNVNHENHLIHQTIPFYHSPKTISIMTYIVSSKRKIGKLKNHSE